jgi:integrase
MKTSKVPYLYCRNGIYYSRIHNKWKSLRTRCIKEAIQKLSSILNGVEIAQEKSKPLQAPQSVPDGFVITDNTINEYLAENGLRWTEREYRRVSNCLNRLPQGQMTRAKALQLKADILKEKTAHTFNYHNKICTAFAKWIIANSSNVINNPFEGLKVKLKKRPPSSFRKAYTSEQLEVLYKLANNYGNQDKRYWLIMLARYTGARMNEICQLTAGDISNEAIHIRGERLKTANAKRLIPLHPRLVELGIFDWIRNSKGRRLFHEWSPVKGSFSHAPSKWFCRVNPFRPKGGGKAEVDFHSIRHTVATEMKEAGVPVQYAAQVLGHSNGNITYDRYGKSVLSPSLKHAVEVIGAIDSRS